MPITINQLHPFWIKGRFGFYSSPFPGGLTSPTKHFFFTEKNINHLKAKLHWILLLGCLSFAGMPVLMQCLSYLNRKLF